MWDSWLFAVRRFMADAGTRLGSWRLSIVLMVAAAFYQALLAIWATSSSPDVVRGIASLVPYWLVYLLLLLNTGVCFWRRLPTLRRQLTPGPTSTDAPPDWERSVGAATGDGEARALLLGLGYRVTWAEPGRVGGVRRRFAPLGSFLFHGAFFVVALGFLLTLGSRREARVWVASGEDFVAQPEQYRSLTRPRMLDLGPPAPRFRVESIAPEFWRDQLLFTNLSAEVALAGGERRTTRINRPLWLGWGTFLRLAGFGYAPRYELRDRDQRVLDSAFVKLDVFPPGRRDDFTLPDYPHRIRVEVLPDFAVEGGEAVTRSLNLVYPAVAVEVWRGRLGLGNAVLRPDDSYRFEGLELSFPELRYWGEFAIVRDPGAPILFCGYLLGLVGLLLKLRGGRGEAEWRAGSGGGQGVLRGWGTVPRRLPQVR